MQPANYEEWGTNFDKLLDFVEISYNFSHDKSSGVDLRRQLIDNKAAEMEPEKKIEMALKPERKTIIKFEWTDKNEKEIDKFYTIEKRDDGKIYFDGKLVPIKTFDQLSKFEKKYYDCAKKDNLDENQLLLKASLTLFYNDEKGDPDDEKYPHFFGNGVMYELTDAFVLRVSSDKHLHQEYTVCNDRLTVRSPSGKFYNLPWCGNDFVSTDFNVILDLLS